MSKELEALERGIIEFEKNLEDDPNNEWLKRVVAGMKKCYQRLESIDKKRCGANVEKVFIDEFVPSKELEKEYLEDLDHYDEGMGIHSTSYEKCKERLIRLAKIDNANPSEALKSLEVINNYGCGINDNMKFSEVFEKEYNTIKQSLLKEQEQGKENAELKRVLSVIKEKSDLSALEMANDVNEFNEMTFHKKPYTQEEFDLLKRYLNDK